MNILEALALAKNQEAVKPVYDRETCENGMLTIADGVFECYLYRLGIEQDEIKWFMEKDVMDRDRIVADFERMAL